MAMEDADKFKKKSSRTYDSPTIELPPPPLDLTRELYKVKKRNKQTLQEHMFKSMRRTKLVASREIEKFEYAEPTPQPISAKEFQEFCENCPSTEMSRFLEKTIRKKIEAKGLEEYHPITLAELIQEAKEVYSRVIHYACMNLKIKNCYKDFVFEIQPYKHVGRTERYQEYLLTRKNFQLRWILHYPIIRRILKESVVHLPYELCHLEFDKMLKLSQFKNALKDQLRTANMTVYEFYTKILSLVDKEQTKQRRKLYTVNYFGACTGIVSIHLSRAIAHTILHIVAFTGCKENKPYLSLNATFNKSLMLEPTAEEIITIYHNFIDDIISIGKKIYVIEQKERRSYKSRYMPLCLTEEFISECKQQISSNINNLYEPIIKYLDSISVELKGIYCDINSEKFFDSIADIVLETGCEQINYYKGYLNKASYIPDNEYFKLGQVSLVGYRLGLTEGLKKNIDDIFERLSSQHLYEVTDLCDMFELIHTRATQKPLTTEQLVETGKFMTWIKKEHMEELRERVENFILNLCQIIDLGILSEEHMELNAEIVHWLDKSLPIIEEHSNNFEQLKYEAEERLQKTVEDVGAAIKEVYPLLVLLDNMDDITRVRSYLTFIKLHLSKIKAIEVQISWINKEEVCLSFPKSTYSEFEDLKNYVYPFHHLLKMCLDVQRNLSVWQDGQFENLDYAATKASVEKYYEELKKMHKTYREKLRRAQDENLPIRFRGTVDDPDILNWPAPLKLCGSAMKLIEDFKPSVEIMRIICNKALRHRHWVAMSEIAGVVITPNAGTTLRKMMKVDFQSNLNEYEIISTGATKEKQLIDNLRLLKEQWDEIKFTVTKYKGVNVLTNLEDVEAVIDEHYIKLVNMRGSVFVKPHEVEVKDFYGKILRIDETVKKWGKMQTQWLRLFPIFTTGILDHMIPKETELFKKITATFNYYMDLATEIQTIIEVVQTPDILENINLCLTNLEIILSGVVTYLETVRLDFPRFYFLDDDELLEIVSRRDPFVSQKFLMTIFQGFHHLTLSNSQVIGVESRHAENIKFVEAIDIIGERKVEALCSQIEKQMVGSLKYYIGECFKVFRHADIKDILSQFPQQALLIMSQVYWTESLETALRLTHNIKLRIYYQKLQKALEHKIKIINEGDKTNLDRLKLKALISNDLNYRFVVKKILDSRLMSENQFDWEAHPKYYQQSGLCTVRMMGINQSYVYEYSGNLDAIVLTPLTDRCYRTLINAYHLQFIGLVKGQSESGKSHTVKALAAILGTFFISFCCLREVNSTTISRLLKGSSLCGSWISLENFNLLKEDVLSAVSQDIYAIMSSKNGMSPCFIGGTSVGVNSNCFVCASVKPSRPDTVLPENLRVLFRTITMISPDIGRIIEVTLCSLGFQNARVLSKKMLCLYSVIEDILPCREHYHFGLNTIKQILIESEELKFKDPSAKEEFIVFSSIRILFLKMLVEDDHTLFDSVLSEFFPDITTTEENNDLMEIIINYNQENNLQTTEKLCTKIIQTYNCLKEAKGIILAGETFTAKTTAMNICEHIFNKLGEKSLLRHTVNPNSLDYSVLYGRLDKLSRVWSDGVISKVVRDFSLDIDNARKWLILDGDVDSSWIENINSILEDENKFYLESGEILSLEKTTTVIFEVENLNGTSPSTISRCRMVYMDPSTLSWAPIVKSWTESCRSEWFQGHQNQILDILNWLIPPCLNFIEKNCRQLCYPNKINLVKSMVQITEVMLDEAYLSIVRKEEDIRNLWTWIQATLIQAGVMGLGSVLDIDSRHKFDEFYRLLWKGQNEDHPYPESFEKLEVGMPMDGLIFDYKFIYKQRGIWKLYQDLLKNEKIVESPYMYEFLVPTLDTLRYQSLLTMSVTHKYPTLLIGPESTGKSILIENILINRLDVSEYEISHINFNINVTSRQMQTYILSKLNKRKAGYFTPPTNKHFLLFIDNLNLLSVNKDTSSLELLRQYMDHKVWYDLIQSHAIYLENVNFIIAMRPIQGNRLKLSQRFLRHFNIFSINEFPEDTISRIYSNGLLHIWKKSGFPSDITTTIAQIVSAALRVYNLVTKRCKPTVNQSYYIFNLSNFTKVIKGCSRLRKETFDANKKIHLKLLPHELLRVFGDRLSCADRSWLLESIVDVINEEFNEEEDVKSEEFKTLMFGTFLDRELPANNRRYEEIVDYKYLVDVVTECLKNYNYYHTEKLDLIFFSYAVDKLLKICRIISMSPGNAILLGLSGTGRQSLTKLASAIYNQTLFQPKITENYTIKDWNKDLKKVLKEAGGVEKECVLLVSEEQLIDESFLQNIDHLLMNGEIPGFYDIDEKQEILELARLAAQGGNRNLDISSSSVFLYFNRRCKENIHLILCLTIDDSLRKRFRQHSSLMTCYIVLCEDWPDESLQSICANKMERLNLEEETKKKLNNCFVFFHRKSQSLAEEVALSSKLQVYITSTAFTHLIKLFIDLFAKKHFETNEKKKRYSQGLAKLSFAANQILNMQNALANYQPQLEAMTRKASEMTEEIALETVQVEKASELVRRDEKIASEQAAVAQVLKSECESELAQAIPILEDAISALNTLKPSDITLVKSMKNPPDAIKLVMAAVCVIKDVKPDRLPDPSTGRKILDYWGPSKRILGDMNFLQSLKDFDKDNIKDELMVKIRKEYLPHKDFRPQVVAKASSAAEGLCKWIIAMDMYDKVAKEVAPKKEKLEKAEREYAATMEVLTEKKEEVARLEEKLANLNELLKDATQKQVKLQKEVDYCNRKLNSAQKLIGSLSGERVRWTEAVENLEKYSTLLVGDILISSGILAYLSPFRDTDRTNLINTWHEYIKKESVPCNEDFDVIKTLASDITYDTLRNGLPQDNFFIVNMVMKEFSQYYSVFIDPHYQASFWIQRMEKRNNLTIVRFSQNDYLTHLKNCITEGKPILIHKIKEYIPPCLNQLLSKQFHTENEELFVEVNNEVIKISKDFRIYMVSNLDFPVFSPAVYKRLTIINFILTEGGLNNNLLRMVSEVEKPELKRLRKELKSGTRKNKAELLELDDKILNTLCESEADILEDEASIKILDQSKDLAKIVRSKQEETKQLETTIDEFRSRYCSVADYCAYLFFFVSQLKKINVVYEFSVEWYRDLFFKSVLKSKRSKDIKERCENIITLFTYDIFYNVSHSLFEKDKVTFLFLLTTSVMLYKKEINENELEFFFKSKVAAVETIFSNPATQWVSEEAWKDICEIETLPEFSGFLQSFTDDIAFWKPFFESQNLGFEDFPRPWNNKLDRFKKLILLKIFRKEHLFKNIKKFVGTELGEKFIQTQHIDLCDIYNESSSISPILIVTTPGMNPMERVKCLAAKKKVLNRLKWLSLGITDVGVADKLIEEARQQGTFLLLQNCHLVSDWLQILEQKIVEMDFDNTHEDFRLWLTTDVSENIPMELLQVSIKIIDEPPDGLKQNLLRLYEKEPIIDSTFYNGCPGKQKTFARFLYGITFFHCLLQEKRKFGVFSWNTPFLFNEEDLTVSLKQLQIFINEDSFTIEQLEKLNYTIGQCNYSGQLDNDWDIRLVTVLLESCSNLSLGKSNSYLFNNLRQYGLPRKNDYKEHLNHIFHLPEDDDPYLFGLNEFSVAFSTVEVCDELITSSTTFLESQRIRDIKGDYYLLLTSIENILNSLPSKLNVLEETEDNYVMLREMKQYNILLDVLQSSLLILRKAFSGDMEISPDFEDMAKSILTNQFPKEWLQFSYPHQLSLSHFVENLCQRVQFFQNPSTSTFWLSAFFFPKALLCKTMLDFSKKLNLALEDVTFDYDVLNNAAQSPEGIVIDGLFVVGARWEKDKATIAELSNTLYDRFPPILLKPVNVENFSKDGRYECPVYQIKARLNHDNFLRGSRNFITSVLLPTEVEPNYWVKRGVKLVCQVPDER